MASTEMEELTTIRIRKAERERIKSLGKKGEDYKDIVKRILDGYEARETA